MDFQTKIPNRLINEKSPYLLQHAYNPVDWYPWCEEAFAKAKAEDKPVFLSIGYSTCHWCHVMERESFEDREVAKILNNGFVSIKVDKEERQDIDSVYMGICQALTGGGGWPLTILMTPWQTPFFAGTYFPKQTRYGRMGLVDLLNTVRQRWETDRETLLEAGEQIAAMFSKEEATASPLPDGRQVAATVYGQLEHSFDWEYGGFGAAPKFPMPHQLLFLLRCHALGTGARALEMVEKTLVSMYKGGIYDHVGGGFSRYSTDRQWLAPHFEKMLYDNALLVMALLECYQVTGKALYRGVVQGTLEYVRREMTASEGGFYSAQDADSEGEEGKFYIFTKEEILTVLGPERGQVFCQAYGVTQQGNFEGKSILNLLHQADARLPDEPVAGQLKQLLQYRAKRYPLHKDDKILTSWNALMIAACARAWRVLGEPRHLGMAENAYRFLLRNLMDQTGGLSVSYRGGETRGTGLLDDYAFLAWASLELYESTFESGYLRQACSLMENVLSLFSREEGGFYLTANNGEALLFRPMEQYDGAVPSGNSVAAWCLVRLAALTGEASWSAAAQRQLESFGGLFQAQPTACAFALLALQQVSYPAQELLCFLPEDSAKRPLARELGGRFHPRTAVLVKSPSDEETLSELAPYTAFYPMGERAAFYLCKNHSCSAPAFDLKEVLEQLN